MFSSFGSEEYFLFPSLRLPWKNIFLALNSVGFTLWRRQETPRAEGCAGNYIWEKHGIHIGRSHAKINWPGNLTSKGKHILDVMFTKKSAPQKKACRDWLDLVHLKCSFFWKRHIINWVDIDISDLFGHFDKGLPKRARWRARASLMSEVWTHQMPFFLGIIGYLKIVYIVAQSEEFPVAK